MTLDEFKDFLEKVNAPLTPHMRYGQRAYNILHDLAPEIAESLNGTTTDPYHDDDRMGEFIGYVFATAMTKPVPTPHDYIGSRDLNVLTKSLMTWGEDRGIIKNSTPSAQFFKAVSEVGELSDALAVNDIQECKDAIGDIYVCLTMLSALLGSSMAECVEMAYTDIAARTGKLVNGVFVRDK